MTNNKGRMQESLCWLFKQFIAHESLIGYKNSPPNHTNIYDEYLKTEAPIVPRASVVR